jgi:hypothetical protein
MAGDLYHAVEEWTAAGGVSKDGITPGRIGHVFFSTKAALKALKGRPPNWRNDTFSGQWPNLASDAIFRDVVSTSAA